MRHFFRTGIFSIVALGAMLHLPPVNADTADNGDAAESGTVDSGLMELPPPPGGDAPTGASVTTGQVVAIASPVPYYIDRGTTMVPMRPLCNFLGIKLSALDGILSFTQALSDDLGRFRVVTLRIGGRSAQISERGTTRQLALALPAETRLGNTFLPLRFVREAFGATIGFRARDNALVVTEGVRRGVLTPPKFVEYRGKNAATLTITNRVGRALSLRLGGPQSVVLELGKGQSVTRKVKPGVYYYSADSTGMKTRSGARRLTGGRRSTWSWGTR